MTADDYKSTKEIRRKSQGGHGRILLENLAYEGGVTVAADLPDKNNTKPFKKGSLNSSSQRTSLNPQLS